MKINKIKSYKVILSIIGVYQILGSLFGLNFLFKDGFLLLIGNPLIFIFFLFAFSYGGYCGGMLLKQKKLKGINLSLINQSFQFVQFQLFGFGFDYVSGTYLGIGLSNKPDLSLYYYQANFRSILSITYRGTDNENFVLINLVALLIFIILLYMKNENKEKCLNC